MEGPIHRLSKRTGNVFYGWWIVSAGIGIQTLIMGLMMQAYGAYIPELQAEFGWSKTALSGAFSLQRVESGILGPAQGWLLTRFGPRPVMSIGLVMLGVGFILFSQVNSLVTFYAVFVLMAIGASLGGFIAVITALVNWFDKKRSTAMGIAYTGLSAGGLVVPLVAISLASLGWRATAVISGLIIMVVGLPLVQLIRSNPEDYGYLPDGVKPGEMDQPSGVRAESTKNEVNFSASEAMHTRAFWFISLGHGVAVLLVSAVMVHFVVDLNENLGYSLQAAALFVASLTIFQAIGQLTGGFLGDRFNKRLILTLTMVGHGVALIVLAFATSTWMVIIFVVLHGYVWGVRGPSLHSLRADYFGRASFAQVLGFSSLIVMIGMTLGPIVAGYLADLTGSYTLGFAVLGAIAIVGSLFFAFAKPPPPPSRQEAVSTIPELEFSTVTGG